ncbi:MAG: helix-turn-helix transcriptional regulator [Bacteroidia bacterium]
MLTNALLGVVVHGQIWKFIPVNPKENRKQLYPDDLQIQLNFTINDILAVLPKMGVHVLFMPEEQHAGMVYDIIKSYFGKRLIPACFYLRHQQIIALTAMGLDVKEIAHKLKIKPVTVLAFRQEIFDYLQSEYKKPRRTHSIIWYAARVGLGV